MVWMNDAGGREKRTCRSRAQLCMLAATNDFTEGGSNDPALLSRFDVHFSSNMQATLTKRPRAAVSACMIRQRNPTQDDEKQCRAFQRHTRQLQKVTYWILRAIHLRAVDDVDFTAARAVIAQFEHHSGIKLPPRTLERILLLARTFTCLEAIYKVYCFEKSPRHGHVPTLDDLPLLERELVASEEVVKACLELMRHSFECGDVRVVLETARQMNLKCRSDDDPVYLQIASCASYQSLLKRLASRAPPEFTRERIDAVLQSLEQQDLRRPEYIKDPAPNSDFPVKPITVPNAPQHELPAFSMGAPPAFHAGIFDSIKNQEVNAIDRALNTPLCSSAYRAISMQPFGKISCLFALRKVDGRTLEQAGETMQLPSGVFMPQTVRRALAWECNAIDAQRTDAVQVLHRCPYTAACEARGSQLYNKTDWAREGGTYPGAMAKEFRQGDSAARQDLRCKRQRCN